MTFSSTISASICSKANVVPTHMQSLIYFPSSTTHRGITSLWPVFYFLPPEFSFSRWNYKREKILIRNGGILWKATCKEERRIWNVTWSCNTAEHTHTHVRMHTLHGYFWFDSLSVLTTDGVLIKSSRNITVSKQSNACQFHNCWVLIQPLTWWIQIGRKPTVHTPTGSSQIRSCGMLQHWASPRKVNCSSNHLSWHWAWGTAAIWLVIKVWSPSFWEMK